MKVAIITVCYNSAETIESAIQTVLSQDYPDVEYIVVDGASSDRTLEIIDQYRDRISQVISEPDKGVYDAINKGIKAASADVVGLMHSDDLYAHPRVISDIVAAFKQHGTDAVYGDLEYVSRTETDKVIRNWQSKPYHRKLFKQGWMPPHPTLYVKRELFDKYGYYNLDLRISADYELMLRYFYKHRITSTYLPQVLVKMRVGGISNVSLKSRLEANQEDRKAWAMNDLKPGIFTLFAKPLSKIFQFLK